MRVELYACMLQVRCTAHGVYKWQAKRAFLVVLMQELFVLCDGSV